MEIKKLELDKNNAVLLFKDTEAAYLNTIRRLILNKVPTMAIDEVTFIENDSALYDEIIANRLGLIPLTTDLESYNLPSKCKCKGTGCARCQLKLTLEKQGPCTVYAEDIKSKDSAIKPVYPKMPIVKLLEGQKLKFIATARLGCGKEHSKWSPGMMFYQGYPEFTISNSQNAKLAAELCPKKILKAEGQKLKVIDATKCDLCKACEDATDGGIKVKGSDKDFIVTIESWGQLSVQEILSEAVKVFDEELDELEEEIKSVK